MTRILELFAGALAGYWPALLVGVAVAVALAAGMGRETSARHGRKRLGRVEWLALPALLWALLGNLRLIALFEGRAELAAFWHGFGALILSLMLLAVALILPFGRRAETRTARARLFYPRPLMLILPPLVVVLEWGVSLGILSVYI